MAIYNGMPSYQFSSPLKPVETLDLLLNTLPEDSSACVSKPIGVRRSATFIVARKCLGNSDDIKTDDLGVWVHKGNQSGVIKLVGYHRVKYMELN